MAKKQALLFELIRDDDTQAPKKGLWEQLFRKINPEKTEPKPENTTDVKLPEINVPQEPAPQNVHTVSVMNHVDMADDQPSTVRLYIRVNNYTIILGITAVLVVTFCGYILGRQMGFRSGIKQRSTEQLSVISNQEPNEDVLKVQPEKPASPAKLTVAANPASSAEMKDILKNDDKITRKNGTNYLIIWVSKELSDVEQAKIFLAEKGIETTIEHKKRMSSNETWHILCSAVGFASLKDAKEKQEAEAFREQIKALGQQYRKVSRGVDFKTCFYARWPIRETR